MTSRSGLRLWQRAAEGIVGLALIAVGIAGLTGNSETANSALETAQGTSEKYRAHTHLIRELNPVTGKHETKGYRSSGIFTSERDTAEKPRGFKEDPAGKIARETRERDIERKHREKVRNNG